MGGEVAGVVVRRAAATPVGHMVIVATLYRPWSVVGGGPIPLHDCASFQQASALVKSMRHIDHFGSSSATCPCLPDGRYTLVYHDTENGSRRQAVLRAVSHRQRGLPETRAPTSGCASLACKITCTPPLAGATACLSDARPMSLVLPRRPAPSHA